MLKHDPSNTHTILPTTNAPTANVGPQPYRTTRSPCPLPAPGRRPSPHPVAHFLRRGEPARPSPQAPHLQEVDRQGGRASGGDREGHPPSRADEAPRLGRDGRRNDRLVPGRRPARGEAGVGPAYGRATGTPLHPRLSLLVVLLVGLVAPGSFMCWGRLESLLCGTVALQLYLIFAGTSRDPWA